MKKSFLCHGSCDARLVSKFGEELERLGIPVFLDRWDISGGALIWSRIGRAIDEALKLVVFASRDFLRGKGVHEELDRALQKAYEKHGEVFIIPVALDPVADILPLLPLRLRAAKWVRGHELGFEEAVSSLRSGILEEPPSRTAEPVPVDFYFRLFPLEDSLVIEPGTGLPVQEGFGFETVWPEPVRFVRKGLGPPGQPQSIMRKAGMWTWADGHNVPRDDPVRILRPAYRNHSITRYQSFYMQVTSPDGSPPNPPVAVRLYDQFGRVVRESVARDSGC